jgi:hypothetical protein
VGEDVEVGRGPLWSPALRIYDRKDLYACYLYRRICLWSPAVEIHDRKDPWAAAVVVHDGE